MGMRFLFYIYIKFLIHREELKVYLVDMHRLEIIWFLIHREELKGT